MAYLNHAYASGVPGSSEERVVFSSGFLSVGVYDKANLLLTLVFKNGYESIRKFVFPTVWEQMKAHPSPGQFYHQNIRSQYAAIPTKTVLKVSDLTKAKNKNRPKLEVK